MTPGTIADAFQLIGDFLREDAFYLESRSAYGDQGEAGLGRALSLFLARPELGFVWLTYDEQSGATIRDQGASTPVAVCVISFAISTSAGDIVAKLDDMFVTAGRQDRGVGSAHLANLKVELVGLGVRRIDTSVHTRNDQARRFYTRHGFAPLGEERLACRL
jgi:GNAT superfamily N-acetyltransferase